MHNMIFSIFLCISLQWTTADALPVVGFSHTPSAPLEMPDFPTRSIFVRVPLSSSSVHVATKTSSVVPKPKLSATTVKPKASSSMHETTRPKFMTTVTNLDHGHVYGCESLSAATEYVSLDWQRHLTKGQLGCAGSQVVLSTITSIYNSWANSLTHVQGIGSRIGTAPATGCATYHVSTMSASGNQWDYCICADPKYGAGGHHVMMEAGAGPEARNVTTICKNRPLPTGWAVLPHIPGGRIYPYESWARNEVPHNCSKGDFPKAECWQALQMTDYVKWWWKFYGNTETCKNGNQNFVDCFYAITAQKSPSNCAVLQEHSACEQPFWNMYEGEWNGIRNFYVHWTIWSINTFFKNYKTSIFDAGHLAGGHLGTIISIVNPEKEKNNVAVDGILKALSWGISQLPYLDFAEYEGKDDPNADEIKKKNKMKESISESIIDAMKELPVEVQDNMFPGDDEEKSEADNWIDLHNLVEKGLSSITEQLVVNVTTAMYLIQSDVNNFLTFAKSGIFSGDLNLDMDHSGINVTKAILAGFDIYMKSQALQAAGVFFTRQLDTDVNALQVNGTKLNWGTTCGSGYDARGTCGTFWYDQDRRISYSIVDGRRLYKNFNEMMGKLASFPDADNPHGLEALFRGSDLCAQASSKAQGSGPMLDFKGDLTKPQCMSNVKVCTWILTPPKSKDRTLDSWSREMFTEADCDVRELMPDYGPGKSTCRVEQPMSNCNSGSSSFCSSSISTAKGLKVPLGYLGFGILNNDGYKNSGVEFCSDYGT